MHVVRLRHSSRGQHLPALQVVHQASDVLRVAVRGTVVHGGLVQGAHAHLLFLFGQHFHQGLFRARHPFVAFATARPGPYVHEGAQVLVIVQDLQVAQVLDGVDDPV